MKCFRIIRQVSLGQTFDIEAETKEKAIKLLKEDESNAELRDESMNEITSLEIEEK